MTPIELRQRLHHQLDQLSLEQLPVVDDFLASLEIAVTPLTLEQDTAEDSASSQAQAITEFNEFLVNLKKRPLRRAAPIRPHAKGEALLALTHHWQGDDLEDCLQTLHETRSEAKF